MMLKHLRQLFIIPNDSSYFSTFIHVALRFTRTLCTQLESRRQQQLQTVGTIQQPLTPQLYDAAIVLCL